MRLSPIKLLRSTVYRFGVISMKLTRIITFLIFCLTAVTVYGETLSVEMGKQLNYRYDKGIKRVAVGDPEIADVEVINSHQLLITSKKVGATSLMLWSRSDVGFADLDATVLVTASDSLERELVDQVSEGALTVSKAGDKLQLSGESPSLETHAQVMHSLEAEDKSVVDATQLGFSSQVQIDIKIVEISRRRLQNAGLFLGKNTANSTLGLSTPGNLTGVGSAGEGALSLLSGSFFPHAQAFNFVYGNASEGILGVVSVLETNGFAYTLAEPSLMAMSGQRASFLAGGEFPVPVIQSGGSGDSGNAIRIRFKEFGVRLSLTPTVLDANRIALKVAPEVSELDFSAGIQSGGVAVPALRVRRTDTSVELGDGESFVISGLVSQNTLASVDKFPWLSDIPILGAFFKSNKFDHNDKELLMVVTPHLVAPIAKDKPLPPLPGERYRRYDPSFYRTFFRETGTFKSKPSVTTGFSK